MVQAETAEGQGNGGGERSGFFWVGVDPEMEKGESGSRTRLGQQGNKAMEAGRAVKAGYLDDRRERRSAPGLNHRENTGGIDTVNNCYRC